MKTKLTADDIATICSQAKADDRTVLKFLLGIPVRPLAADRIRAALQALNIA